MCANDPCSFRMSASCALDGSIEAEIITFLKKKAIFGFSTLSYKYFKVAPLPELKLRPQRPFIQRIVFFSVP